MPSWISVNGVWKPKKERVYDTKKDEIYEGPDRAALEILEEEKVEHLGMPIENDPQLLEIAQRMGLSVEDYIKRFAPSKKQVEAQQEEHNKVVDHKPEPKRRGVKPRGGGVTITGGFGDTPA